MAVEDLLMDGFVQRGFECFTLAQPNGQPVGDGRIESGNAFGRQPRTTRARGGIDIKVVIRFKDPDRFSVDFPYLLQMIHGSFMSRRNTIVVPGGRLGLAMEIIFTPIVVDLMRRRESYREPAATHVAGLKPV